MADPRATEPEPWVAERAPWLTIDTDGYAFACLRCGAQEPFEVPLPDLHEWVAAGQAFVESHRRCKAVPVAASQEAMLG